jgi:plasmid stabilization system protein ParE
MEYKILISPEANNDIFNIYQYILNDGETIAKNQARLIYDGIETLKNFPFTGIELAKYVKRTTDYKFITIKKLYLVVYKIVEDSVRVVRVFRCEQDYLHELGLN